jgi:hypothetical protein
LVGQAADALAGFYIPHPPIQPTKRDSRMALVSTSGKKLTEQEVVAFLRVLVSDTFNWEVKRHNDLEFKVLFPTKGDLTKMTKFNAEMKEGVTLKFQEFKEDEEYFGHALPVVWMRVSNLQSILKEYAILWALGTLFGVTQDVDMVTSRANSFGRFAVAVLEPEAIPTKLDVIIGNRYFQLLFQVEPYLPNVGLRSIWNNQSGGNDGSGAAKDTEMNENNGAAFLLDASGDNAENTSINGKEAKAPEAQMDIDLSEDDLLGEENDLSEAARDFVGVKKGNLVEVRSAASLSSSALARMLQCSSQPVKVSGKPGTPAMVAARVVAGPLGQAQQPTMGMTAQTRDANQNLGKMSMPATLEAALDQHEIFKQPFITNDDVQMEVSVGQQKERLQMVHTTLVLFLMP